MTLGNRRLLTNMDEAREEKGGHDKNKTGEKRCIPRLHVFGNDFMTTRNDLSRNDPPHL